jgi:hypothetical protein
MNRSSYALAVVAVLIAFGFPAFAQNDIGARRDRKFGR